MPVGRFPPQKSSLTTCVAKSSSPCFGWHLLLSNPLSALSGASGLIYHITQRKLSDLFISLLFFNLKLYLQMVGTEKEGRTHDVSYKLG